MAVRGDADFPELGDGPRNLTNLARRSTWRRCFSLIRVRCDRFDHAAPRAPVAGSNCGRTAITRSGGKITITSVPSRNFERIVKVPP
jgi:hypothetical protein